MSGRTLKKQTDEMLDSFLKQLPAEVQAVVGGAFERLMNSDAGSGALQKGDKAKDFCLQTCKGSQLSLSQLLENGPVVLSFYRGGWCPFCNLEMRALQQVLSEIKSFKASLVGISPEKPDVSAESVKAMGLDFDVVVDAGNKVAADYGLLMEVDYEVRPYYEQWGIDLIASNGDDSWVLPLPATYVIDQDGVIRGSYVDKNYTARMEPKDVVDILSKL